MASCKQCGKQVGCACNLINGKCRECHNAGPKEIKPKKVENIIKVGVPQFA